MSLSFKLEKFEGPLDLLLQILEKQTLGINEISLSKVTEQYLNFVDEMEEDKAENIADFLVVASRLLLLKSKYILPIFEPEEDDGMSLEDRLKLYKVFVNLSKKINNLWESRVFMATRKPAKDKKITVQSPQNLTLERLHSSMLKLMQSIEPPKKIPFSKIDKTISMKEKINFIREILNKRKNLKFNEILRDKKNKTELIVSFLALLELVKMHRISLKQNNVFDEILISRN